MLHSLFLICFLSQQTQEPLPQGYPRIDAIQRQYSELDPQALFEKLRDEGTFPLQGRPENIRLLQQNMDADDALEYVIVLEGFPYQIAIVMKQIDRKWWTLGTLMSNNRGDSDAFVSLKPLVWPGTYDLIVRSGGSQGTGVGQFHRTVYRILRGNLYPVFAVTEEEWNWTSSKSAKITYPKLGTILVRGPRDCTIHYWNISAFAFSPSKCGER